MKNFLLLLGLPFMLSGTGIKRSRAVFFPEPTGEVSNLVIVTIDGLRWQEVFNGADSAILQNPEYTLNGDLQQMLYWHENAEQRRKMLMPFFWNVLAAKGQVAGNRDWNNRVDVANPYRISYAGYNEMFTGVADWRIFSNQKKLNANPNIFERLNRMDAFRNRIALFSSWNVFPYILRKEKNDFYMNSAYAPITDTLLADVQAVQENGVFEKHDTRHDWLTFIAAKEYMQKAHPRVLLLALGETDEYAHKKDYDMYLHHINAFDRMLGELWAFLQSDPQYRNNTRLLVTTDHGRGNAEHNWHSHGLLTPGSSQTWVALLGPGIAAAGERKDGAQWYARDMPELVLELLNAGENNMVKQINPANNYGTGKSK